MANFLLAFHGGGAPATPEEGQEVLKAWGRWYEGMGDAVVDPGNPTSQAKSIAADGSVSDGGGANPVSGYAIIKADSLDEAVEHAKGCPHLASGGSVEVAETYSVM